jgi:predicted MFS family arabinose efflux permease
MLVLVGIGFSIGNLAGGRLADRTLNGSLIVFLTLLVAIMLAFPQLAQSHGGAAFAIVVWGIATFAVVPPLQMRVMRAAAEAPAWPPRSMSVPSIWVMRWGRLPVVPPSPPGLAMALCRLSVP